MIVSLVVAMDERGGIGKDQRLPWRLRADLRQFKQLTLGHHLIMGRKTYETIGRPLPGRTTIIITRNRHYHPENTRVAYSLEEALSLAEKSGESEAFIIGGGEIFGLALDLADRIYLTQVHATLEADTYFPEYEQAAWTESPGFYQPADEENEYAFTFKVLEKVREPGG